MPQRYEKPIAELYVVVAKLDSRVVGFGTLNPDTGEVVAVYVAPQVARQGIGAAILAELLSQATTCGLSEVHCKSSLCAEAFYAKAGFQAGPRCKHRFRSGQEIDCIPMTKSLG
jgi:putative acetyltransferase